MPSLKRVCRRFTRLRVQDLDFEMKQLTVRDGKGAKDRFTVLAEGVIPPLREHLAGVQLTHQEDLAGGYGAVYLPGALDRKYPKAAREWGWQYVFPARDLSRDPRSEVTRRHHLDEGTINKAIKPAVARVGIVKRASSHTFRQNAECREMPSELSQTVRALRDSCVLGSMDSAFSEALQER